MTDVLQEETTQKQRRAGADFSAPALCKFVYFAALAFCFFSSALVCGANKRFTLFLPV